jgi:hypothetical protein
MVGGEGKYIDLECKKGRGVSANSANNGARYGGCLIQPVARGIKVHFDILDF